ncbi:MAG: type II toxin-antitoxin system VapC family toxin [Propionibacteriaceae bacterium]|nr:type II toxin-antitoxin system VapC family toxin [Propionibacteriaceae bacterium]
MIILDTNIISVLAAARCHPANAIVDQWFASCDAHSIRTTAITRAEAKAGVESMPDGARKDDLRCSVNIFFATMAEATLPFTARAADQYGLIVATRQRSGHPISVLDAQIAAIALTAGATLATRNVKDFADLGLSLVDPYDRATWGR